MNLPRRSQIPNGMLLLAVAAGMFWYSDHDFTEALARYNFAPSVPLFDYVVSGHHENISSSGKGRRVVKLLELTVSEPQPPAPQTTELAVAGSVYEQTHNGDHWRARSANGQLLFDPRLSGVEHQTATFLKLLALVFAVAGVATVAMALRNRA